MRKVNSQCGTEEALVSDEREIRELIERWAAAVHAGDLDGVADQHAEDILMFDVPPPEEGVRGMDAYRATWPGFLGWQAAGTAAKDLDGLMAHIAPDVVSYEQGGRMAYTGVDEVREVCREGPASAPGRIDFDIPDLAVRVSGDLAVAWGLDRVVADGAAADSRGTRVFERPDGEWQMIHQHLSVPAEG